MVATDNTGRVKSSVARNESGVPVLELRLDRDRAWATVGQALTRAEVPVEDQDQLEGVYFVRIVPEAVLTGEEKGWFSGIPGSRQKRLRAAAAHRRDRRLRLSRERDRRRSETRRS